MGEVALGYGLSISAGLCLTLDALLIKRSTYLMENYLTATLWCYLVATLISAVAMVIFEHLVLPQNWFQVFSYSYTFSWIYFSISSTLFHCEIFIRYNSCHSLQYNSSFHAGTSVHSAFLYPPRTQKLDRSCRRDFRCSGLGL